MTTPISDPTSAPIPACTKCGAPMPAAQLGQVHITCPYCGKVEVAPPPSANAWLEQHRQIVAPPRKAWDTVGKINNGFIWVWALVVGGIILSGILLRLLEVIW